MSTPWTIKDVRAELAHALRAALIGPFASIGTEVAEVLTVPPSRWYASGFLTPERAHTPDNGPARHDLPPSFIGMSVLVPAREPDASLDMDVVRALVRYADYICLPVDATGPWQEGAPRHWQRVPRRAIALEIPLDARVLRAGVDVPESRGLVITGAIADADADSLAPGTRALSLFVVNRREPQPGALDLEDEHVAFQVSLELLYAPGLVPWPAEPAAPPVGVDEHAAALHGRDLVEYAVGHGVAVEAVIQPGAPVTVVRTKWLPEVAVPRAIARPVADAITSMDALATLESGAAVAAALAPLAEALRTHAHAPSADVPAELAASLGELGARAAERVAEGVALLERDPLVRDAFCLAHMALARARRQHRPERDRDEGPRWHAVQLALLLAHLPALADDQHPARDHAQLVALPPGLGSTEACLGLMAVALVLRRLRPDGHGEPAAGTAVLLRDQPHLGTGRWLERVAALLCALELVRADTPRLGTARFSLGLWHGRDRAPAAAPLGRCPWCGAPLSASWLACARETCLFAAGLPVADVLGVPGDVRERMDRPCVVMAVDDEDGLPAALWPPALVLETGAYLTSGRARALPAAPMQGHARPMVLVTGGGLRRVRTAARALHGSYVVFPPPAAGSFAPLLAAAESDAQRLIHMAVAAPGRARDAVLARVCAVLMGAASRAAATAPADADPYMTLVVGTPAHALERVRAMITAEVAPALASEPPLPLIWPGMDAAAHPWTQRRQVRSVLACAGDEDVAAIAEALARLSLPHADGSDDAVDVAIAPIDFLAGGDVARLALCVLAGPPQSVAAHRAASAIIAPAPARPALVVTVFDSSDARERCLYERFLARQEAAHLRFEPVARRAFPRAAREPAPTC